MWNKLFSIMEKMWKIKKKLQKIFKSTVKIGNTLNEFEIHPGYLLFVIYKQEIIAILVLAKKII